MSKLKFIIASLLALASISWADVSVLFTNSLPVTTKAGNITLDFTVDGAGAVTLDASTTDTNAATIVAVDAWDGAAGTVSYVPAYGTSFSVALTGSLPMRLTNLGGLGVQGQNQNRLDNPGIESILATPTLASGIMNVKSVDWASRANTTVNMQLGHSAGSIIYSLPTATGSWDVSTSNVVVLSGADLTFGNEYLGDANDGYVLKGFSFDLGAEIPIPGIAVTFTNSIPIASLTTNQCGNITLDFSVDGSGFVTLDASTASAVPGTVAAVDAWDGPVGYTDYTGVYNTTFSMTVGAGAPTRLSEWGGAGGGIGYSGQNAWRIDRPGVEEIVASASVSGASIVMKKINWTSRADATTDMLLVDPRSSYTNTLPSATGSLNISAENLYLNNGENLVIGNASNTTAYALGDGYTLQGFEFTIVEEIVIPVPGLVDVAFSYDGANMNFSSFSVALNFAIDGSGVVSLDASTDHTNAVQIAAVDAWDSANVGFVTNTTLFGESFSLTAAANNESNSVPITLWSNDGGVMAVQGQNSGRIDGQTLAIPNLETLRWTLSGNVKVDFTEYSYGNALNNGGIELNDADTFALYTNTAVSGFFDLTGDGYLLTGGQALTFQAVTNFNWGCGIGGFSFSISESGLTPYETWATGYGLTNGPAGDDDNDGLSNLYEFGVGGNPINGTVAPAYMPVSSVVNVGGSSNVIEYVYTRREPVPVDMQYYLNVSTTGLLFPNWTNTGYTVEGEANAAAGFKTVTNQIPVDANAAKFIKLVVEQN